MCALCGSPRHRRVPPAWLNVRCVPLAGNNVGDDGAVALGKALALNASLTEVDLSVNNVSAAVYELRLAWEARPSLNLRF